MCYKKMVFPTFFKSSYRSHGGRAGESNMYKPHFSLSGTESAKRGRKCK